jgi:hypothetical protein
MGDEGVLMEAIEVYGDESDKFQLDLPITERVNVPLARHLTPNLNVTPDFVLEQHLASTIRREKKLLDFDRYDYLSRTAVRYRQPHRFDWRNTIFVYHRTISPTWVKQKGNHS